MKLAEIMPLTPVQDGILYASSLDTDTADPYTVQADIGISGALDPERLHRSAQAVFTRHPNLRAAFRRRKNGMPVALILDGAAIGWTYRDLSALDDGAARREWSAICDAARDERFDLSSPPLLRLILGRVSEDRWRLLVTNHHLILDGWSAPRLVGEILLAYADGGSADALPPVRSFREYLHWLSSRDTGAALDRWRALLGDDPAACMIAEPNPAALGRRPQELRAGGLGDLGDRLAARARAHGLTVGALIQAAWGVSLGLEFGRTDVLFGTTVSGRSPEFEGAEEIVGMTLGAIPVRVRSAGAQSLVEVAAQVQREQATVLTDHWLGLPAIAGAVGAAELFDTLLVIENHPASSTELNDAFTRSGLTLTGVEPRDSTHYPLTVQVVVNPRLELRVHHLPEAVPAARADRLARTLVDTLERLADHPDTPVAALRALADDDLRGPAGPPQTPAAEVPELAELLSLHGRAPEAVAVASSSVRLTTAELEQRVADMCEQLSALGVGPESVVAVALPRSADAVIALLAVLRAGGAVLPIDLGYPRELIDHILADAVPEVIVTSDGPTAHRTSHTASTGGPRGDNLAYLVYTSGSTGVPKAVAGTRDGLAARLAWAGTAWTAEPGDVRLLKSSFAFIDGLTELLGAVAAGASMVVAGDEERTDPAAQAALLQRYAIAQITAVPSLAATLATTAPAACAGVRRWVISGEPLSGEIVREVRTAAPGAQIVNSYGSSEVVGDVTVATLPADEDGDAESAPIGHPVPGTGIVLLDDLLRPVPAGTVGEIYVTGRQVARGYRGRPALTAERFVADPSGSGRLYRTGDRGRRLDDGRLAFHGRVDGQVQIRGHRVETVGVEAALRRVPGVTAAVVFARPDSSGSQTLWAYVTVDPAAPTGAEQVRGALAARSPGYQVPTVVVLESLPTLPNGKVNRRALPEPQTVAPAARREPRPGTEAEVAAIFADLLGLTAVGRDDDFFHRGGHSLLATRLIHRLAAEYPVQVSVRTVFDRPTVAGLAAELDARRDGGGVVDVDAPTAGPRPEPLPATAAQRSVWAAEQLTRTAVDTPEAAYNLPFGLALTGPLDTGALRAAATAVIDRHEALRTGLEADDQGGLWARIAPPGTAAVVTEHNGPGAQAALAAARTRPFDLAHELPVRIDVARTGPDRAILQLTVHHTAADEWCAPVLFADLADAYQRALGGADGPFAAAPLQYADAALWQDRTLDRPDADGVTLRERERDYWARTLRGVPDELTLPYDRARPENPTGRGDVVEFALDDRAGAGLRELARAHSATPFMIAHAAVVAAWAQLTGDTDITLGTPVANRTHRSLDAVMGMFTNTVVLRTRVDDDPTVATLIARIREADLGALDHQQLPFGEIVEAVDPARRFGRNPLFQTMIQYRGPVPEPDFAGLSATVVSPAPSGAKFDLTVEFLEHADRPGLAGRIEFARDLFTASTVERIAAMVVRALEQLTAGAAVPISRLDLVSDADRDRRARANATGRDVDPALDLPALIARSARAHPDAVAVVSGADSLTYAELTAAVDRLARRLAAAGAGVDHVVAVDLPRSVALSVAVLAAHRVGAAYLPLDRDHPPARRAFVLDDAAPAAVVTDVPDADFSGVPVLVVDGRGEVTGDRAGGGTTADLVAPGTLPAQRAAYLLYTSGSTGTPKAVVIDHRAIVNRLLWMQDRFGLTPGERVLHKTPTGFDVSVWELFWPLTAGATLVMAAPGVHRDPAAIAATLIDEQISTVHFVPSMLRAFLAETEHQIPSLTRILCSGEPLTSPLRDGVRERFPLVRLHNLYGPTEAAVDVTEIDVTDLTGSSVPIGTPVWNTGVHVLGRTLDERPIGAWGDLYLSGVQLARGYAGRPALTAAHFVASPLTGPGERLYRTGDIARWTDGGVLEYAGRSDSQLKLRGQRVEPGEVEQALLATGALRQAVCVGHTTADGRTLLAAYGVSADRSGQLDAAAVLTAVAATLPAALVPATLTVLDELPVTANGKLDRLALPEPVVAGAGGEAIGPAEQAVAEVFGEVLPLPDGAGVERADDFFALGGDSIVAITVINRLRRRGIEVDVREIFTHRTVESLAQIARIVEPAVAEPDAGPPAQRTRPLPLTPIAAELAARGGRWQSLAQSITVALPGTEALDRLPAVLEAVLARHEALRLRVQVGAGGVWSMQPAAPGAVATEQILSVHRFDSVPGRDHFAAIAARVHGRLDPTETGCLQAAAVQGPDRSWLVLVIHHLAVDAVSWRILLDDLAAADADVAAGRPAALPAPVTGFAQYTDAVAELAAGPGTMADAARWRTLLTQAAPLRPGRPAGTQSDLVTTSVELTAAATRTYLDSGSVTADFVADVGAAIAHWRREVTPGTAETPFLIDVEGHGRDIVDADLSETVGWITAVWPVLVEPVAADAHARVARQLAEPGYGYGLARYGNPRTARLLARAPHAEILVNYLGTLDLRGGKPWQPVPEARWTRTVPAGDLSVRHPLTVDGRVERSADGSLVLVAELTWSNTVFAAPEMEVLADALRTALQHRGAVDAAVIK